MPTANRQVLRCVPENDPQYRYVLEVRLDAVPHADRRLCVIQKNPSHASAFRSDATVGKVEAWARRQQQHHIAVITYINLFARRASVAATLNGYAYDDCVGLENNDHIKDAAKQADLLVAAWGNPNGYERDPYDCRVAEVVRLLAGYDLYRVGPLTQRGYPRHGRLWNGDPELAMWRSRHHIPQ